VVPVNVIHKRAGAHLNYLTGGLYTNEYRLRNGTGRGRCPRWFRRIRVVYSADPHVRYLLFLLIRPQQKKTKEHRQMIDNLKTGDRIITSGGLHGRITGVSESALTVEIAEKVRVKVNRGSVSAIMQTSPPPVAPKKDKKEKADNGKA
jgi:preprotein translocase subunit YajC